VGLVYNPSGLTRVMTTRARVAEVLQRINPFVSFTIEKILLNMYDAYFAPVS
jgi:hypothetical protein